MIYLIIIFIILLFLVGFYFKKRNRTKEDYILAGRNVPAFLIAASLAANDIGAGASLGLIQSSAKGEGLSSVWYIWLMIPSYLIGSFVAPRIRLTNAKTVPDFFKQKYGRLNQILAAIFMTVPNIGIVAINLTAAGALLQIILNVEFIYALSISVGVTLIYSYLGGLWADIVTDTIQIIAIVIGFSLVLFFLSSLNNNSQILSNLKTNDLIGDFSFSKLFSLFALYSANFIVGLSTTTRIYASKSKKEAKKGILYCIPIYFIYAFIPAIIGLLIVQYSNSNFQLNDIVSIIQDNVPVWILAILFIGILSASLSTVDTLLIASSAIIQNDILSDIKNKRKEKISETKQIRIILVIITLISFAISAIGINDIIGFLIFLLSIQTVTLFIPFLLGHYKKEINKVGATITIIVALITYLITDFMNIEYYIFQPFLTSIIISVIVFLITSKRLKKNKI